MSEQGKQAEQGVEKDVEEGSVSAADLMEDLEPLDDGPVGGAAPSIGIARPDLS